MNIYQQELLDHYHHSPYRGILDDPDFSSDEYNPSCGDKISFQGNIKENVVKDIAFNGSGCVISQAVASLLAHKTKNNSIDFVDSLDSQSIITMIGISLGPTRLKCALLPLHALKQGIKNYCKKQDSCLC